MKADFLPEGHKSGFVALVGRPNVGKSTLINAILAQQVAAVSPRPQTTRRRQLGILTLPEAQIIFMDTPGIHKPVHKLGRYMNREAQNALEDADIILVLYSLLERPTDEDKRVAGHVQRRDPQSPVLVALNMIDLIATEALDDRSAEYQALLPDEEIMHISATRGDNLDRLLQRIIELLPTGPRYYPEDDVTDVYERDIAADLIRAATLVSLRDEVPHCIAVHVDEYKERNQHGAYIHATLFVERDSQKGIVIGKGGSMLRQIGSKARHQIEAMSGRKVYLELRVKVLRGWRNNTSSLKQLGFLDSRR
jgi:GTP-binding protein Era